MKRRLFVSIHFSKLKSKFFRTFGKIEDLEAKLNEKVEKFSIFSFFNIKFTILEL